MAWKLRKDKLQADAPTEDTGLIDTAVAPEPSIDTRTPESESDPLSFVTPEPPRPPQAEEPMFAAPTFDPEMNPFVFVAPEPELSMAAEEPTFAPLSFEPTQPTMEDENHRANEGSPHFLIPEPTFTDTEDAPSAGPFAPYPSEKPMPPDSPLSGPSFVLLDREEVAPSLVHSEGDSEIPRVAPFIVDVPPVAPPVAATAGNLVVRIGNLSANFILTKDVTIIGRPDSLLQSYPDIEIELDDAVSRRHAEIRRHEGGYVVVDMRSTNGTLLNGERLDPHREYPLAHGDRMHLGDRTEIVFE